MSRHQYFKELVGRCFRTCQGICWNTEMSIMIVIVFRRLMFDVHGFPVRSHISFHINFITQVCCLRLLQYATSIIYITVQHVFKISTWRLNLLLNQVWPRHPVMRFMSVYSLLLMTCLAASRNSRYLSSSSACPPALEVLCIEGKPSDTPSSIDPGKRGEKKITHIVAVFWISDYWILPRAEQSNLEWG